MMTHLYETVYHIFKNKQPLHVLGLNMCEGKNRNKVKNSLCNTLHCIKKAYSRVVKPSSGA